MLSDIIETGVIWLKIDGRPGFVNEQARQLLADGHEDGWDAALKALKAHCAETGGRFSEWSWRSGEQVRHLCVEPHLLADTGGTLVLLADRDRLALLAQSQPEAMQCRNLTRLYIGIAHDLRSPLNAMVMNLELLKQMTSGSSGLSLAQDRQRRYVEVLSEEIGRLNNYLSLLLDQLAPARDTILPINLNELLATLQRLLEPQIRQQRVRLTMTAPVQTVRVYGCADRIKHALLSVLVTALQALPDGGELTVTLDATATLGQVTIRAAGATLAHDRQEELVTARQVLAQNGGTLSLTATGQDGASLTLTLTLTLPLSA